MKRAMSSTLRLGASIKITVSGRQIGNEIELNG